MTVKVLTKLTKIDKNKNKANNIGYYSINKSVTTE